MLNIMNDQLNRIEKYFNILGCIPLVSILSGGVRAFIGKIQAVGGLVIAAIGFFSQLVNPQDNQLEQTKRLGIEHLIQGVLNVFRGLGECLTGILGIILIFLGFFPFVLLSLVWLIPNLIQNRNFNPFFKYGTFTNTTEILR